MRLILPDDFIKEEKKFPKEIRKIAKIKVGFS